MTDEQTGDSVQTLQGGQDLMIEVDGKMIPNYDATIMTFEEGDIVTGTVVRVDKDEVLVDIGYKSEGVVPANELSIRKSVDPAEEVSVGDVVDALVLTKEDADGRLILSRKRARFERAWQRIEKAAEEGTPVSGSVIEVVKGGLIIDLGVRGFLPASLVDIRRVADLDEFLGQTLECRVIELNRFRNNVVLSRRAVLEEERRGVREQILDRMNVGDLVTGTISNIVDFGAFVDLEGIDGLIHISELSWSHVNHPSEVLTIGQKVTVRVLDIDRDRQRISLGLKQTQKDPWQQVFENRQVNEIVHGRVTKLVSFGAFVEIEEGVEGLIHISELAQHHVEDPSEVVRPGQEVNVKIIEIDPERRRLSLSLKRLEPEYRIHEDALAEEGEEGEEGVEVGELEAAEAGIEEVAPAEVAEEEAAAVPGEEAEEAEEVEKAEAAEAIELAEAAEAVPEEAEPAPAAEAVPEEAQPAPAAEASVAGETEAAAAPAAEEAESEEAPAEE
ncbi:MAG TPA: 30S ribosomal protein S1 [Thermoleophilia bacterium]|nr:30S ribosomal protein S1 [Thermoleophilia bacterium]